MIEQIKNIDSSRAELRKFGLLFGIIAIGIACYFIYNAQWFTGVSLTGTGVLLLVIAWMTPAVLLPFQKIWMGLSIVLGWFMTRLLLTAVFYIVLTPLSWFTKLLGTRYLELNIDPGQDSYWQERDPDSESTSNYEKQY